MPIRILDSPEPLTLASQSWTDRVPLAASRGAMLFEQELRRYCNRQIDGRSFLIAGHRGAGKTTMISAAVQQVLRDSQNASVRPVLVWLHGPSLLPDPAAGESMAPLPPTVAADPAKRAASQADSSERSPVPAASTSSDTSPASPAEKAQHAVDARRLMIAMILQLHREVAREFAVSYRHRKTPKRLFTQAPSGEPWVLLPWVVRNRLELAAELERMLFDRCDFRDLREIWRQGGALGDGVLFPSPTLTGRPSDQGVREILALGTLCQAYLRISGTFQRTDTENRKSTAKSDISLTVEAAKDAFQPFLTALTGGAAGAAAYASSKDPFSALVAGGVGALAAALTLKGSASRSRERTTTQQDTFVFNFSVDTLDRILPVIIERLIDAGLLPVFVVDELDKVPDWRRIMGLVTQMKKLVAERVFFCFLTDRRYFEEVTVLLREQPYAYEHTFFTHRVFVVLGPKELHQFLDELLIRPALPGGRETLLATTTARDASSGATEAIQQDKDLAEDFVDYPLIAYVLLHRSEMHAIDLRRQIIALRKGDALDIRRGAVRTSLEFWFDILIQLAIEIVLDDDDLRQRMEDDPGYRRLANDAMYYLTRQWEVGTTVELGLDSGRTEFLNYLRKRAGSELITLRDDDTEVDFLFEKVRRLASIIAEPGALRHEFQRWTKDRERAGEPPLDPVVFETVSLRANGPTPLVAIESSSRFVWRCDRYGREINRGAREPLFDWVSDAALIEGMQAWLAQFAHIDFTVLSTELRVIPTIPAWSQVERALEHLRSPARAAKPGDTDAAQYAQWVHDFAEILRQHGTTIGSLIVCGAAIGQAARTNDPDVQLYRGARTIAQLVRFDRLEAADVDARLRALLDDVKLRVPAPLLPDLSYLQFQPIVAQAPQPILSGVNHAAAVVAPDAASLIAGAVQAVRAHLALGPREVEVERQNAWASWQMRHIDYLHGKPFDVTFSDLVTAAAGVPPGSLFTASPGDMRLCDWSDVLVHALADEAPNSDDYAPSWIAAAALEALGFGFEGTNNVSQWLASVRSWHARPSGEAALSPISPPARLRPGVLILRRNESVVSPWRISKWTPALALTRRQYDRLVGSDTAMRSLMSALGLQTLVMELPADGFEMAQVDALSQGDAPLKGGYLYATRVDQMSAPAIVAPTGPDDLVRLAQPFSPQHRVAP